MILRTLKGIIMRALLGLLLGIAFTYGAGALIGWSWNPGDWHWAWRILCVCFAIFWGLIGLTVGIEIDSDAHYEQKLKDVGRR